MDHHENKDSFLNTIKNINVAKYISYTIGIIMIILSGYLLFFCLNELYLAYISPNTNTFILSINQFLLNQPLISTNKDGVVSVLTIGESGAKITAFSILFMFTFVGVSVATSTLKSSIHLLFPTKF